MEIQTLPGFSQLNNSPTLNFKSAINFGAVRGLQLYCTSAATEGMIVANPNS
jgi:hypothetical protein